MEYSKQSIHCILWIFGRFCLLLCLARDTNGLKHTDTNVSNYFQKSVWQKSKSWCIHTINLPWERVLSKAFSNSTCNSALSVVFLAKQQYLRRDLVKQTWNNCYKHSTGGNFCNYHNKVTHEKAASPILDLSGERSTTNCPAQVDPNRKKSSL